jgi:hypothetical protein
MALAMGLSAQTPATSPAPSAPATVSPSASAFPSDLAESIQRKVEKKLHGQPGIAIDSSDHNEDADLRKMREFVAIPIVAIVFLSIFGAPVLIVIMIGMFALLISRMRQRTIRMMVEKGQPVPAELLAPATRGVRRRSDVRRGVIWAMIGLGAMIFFGAVNDWEGGAWSLGLIPFLIGLGYLLVWKLEGKKDVPPPPPVP